MSTPHPSRLELEMWHTGERPGPLVPHLDSCAICQRVLEQLDEERRVFASRTDPERFVRELRLRIDRETERSRRPRWLAMAAGMAAALGVLALLAVPVPRPSVDSPPNLTLDERARTVDEAGLDDLIPKGSGAAAGNVGIIVKRGDEQTLVRGKVTIVPGDELRLSFMLPERARRSAGILTDAGEWVPFFEGEFDAGTHTPEATLRVDGEPSSGRLFFGSPEDLARVRAKQSASGAVSEIALEWRERP